MAKTAAFGVFDEEPTKEQPAPKQTLGSFEEEIKETAQDNRYLVFKLAGEYYATPLLGVREIVEPQDYKPVPNTMKHFLGVINLRGQIVGLIDLRLRFGLASQNKDEQPALVVFDSPSGPLAALVDRVESVSTIHDADIERKPNIQTSIPQNYLIGIGKHNKELVSILDLQKILSADELISIRNSRNAVG
ncbi:MAG: chemotaxis protein CheW [Oligoflexales bacterium]